MDMRGCIYTVVVRRADGEWVTMRTTDKFEAQRWSKALGLGQG